MNSCDSDCVGVVETRCACNQLNAVSVQLIPDHSISIPNDVFAPQNQITIVTFGCKSHSRHKTALVHSGQLDYRFTQRLAGNRTRDDANSTRNRIFLDDSNLLPSLAAWMAAFCPAGSTPYNNHV